MIYIIGGPVRVGKSRLAKLVLERNKIASITTDALTSPIGHLIPESRLWGGIPQVEWEDNAYPFIRRFLKTIQFDYPDYLIEGAPLSPRIAHKLADKFDTRQVFLGNTNAKAEDLVEFMGTNVWLANSSQEDIEETAKEIRERSLFIADEAIKYNYPYIDLTGDYLANIETAYGVLMEK